MKNKIILIGPINQGKIACTGDAMKNQLFVKRFSEVFDKVIFIDTYHWRKRPWCIIDIFFKILVNIKAKIIVSANPGSADKLIKILNAANASKRLFYWVVGGSFHIMLEKQRFQVSTYSNLAGIFVQGTSMEMSLRKQGLNNAVYVPNSKYIHSLPIKHPFNDGKFHFVFLSRIEREKGCNHIIKAADILNKSGYKDKFDITFYGKTTSDLSYKEEFLKQVKNNRSLKYMGVLDLQNPDNYQELSRYDVMLFPTYWDGEGFPGVIIDAYIAGLPVIASDWNLNSDVVRDGETGWIVPTHDINALASKMMYAVDHPEIVAEFSYNSQKMAKKYDIRLVLSDDNLKELGIL